MYSPNLSKSDCMSDVARIGSIIIFHLSKLWKVKFSILCDAIFLSGCRGILILITLRSERVKVQPLLTHYKDYRTKRSPTLNFFNSLARRLPKSTWTLPKFFTCKAEQSKERNRDMQVKILLWLFAILSQDTTDKLAECRVILKPGAAFNIKT